MHLPSYAPASSAYYPLRSDWTGLFAPQLPFFLPAIPFAQTGTGLFAPQLPFCPLSPRLNRKHPQLLSPFKKSPPLQCGDTIQVHVKLDTTKYQIEPKG